MTIEDRVNHYLDHYKDEPRNTRLMLELTKPLSVEDRAKFYFLLTALSNQRKREKV